MATLNSNWQVLNSTTISGYGYTVVFRLYGKLNSQDVANNRSSVSLSWDYEVTYGWITSYDAQDYLTNAGWNDAAYREYRGSGTLRSWTGNISHNSDGTGSGSATGRTRMGGMGVDTGDVSASYTLPTIPRASKPSGTPNPLTIGSSGATLTINTNRKASSFTHTVKVTCGSWSWTSSARAVGASVDVTVPYSVIAQFSATSKTATATITCTTFSGTTQIGSAQTASVTFQVNSSVDHANIGTITVQDTNARTRAVTQDNNIYIANISTLEATIPLSVSGTYTELASATVTCGTQSQTYSLSGTSQTITFTFDKVNASNLTVTVKDKRGNTVTGSKTWTLISYQPVTAVATVGRPTATGSVGVGQVTGMAYGGNFGATQNSLTIVVDFKKNSDSNYDPQGTETYTLALSQSGYNSWTDALTFNYTLDYQYQYDIRFTVSDLFSTAVYTARMMQGFPILSWDETEVDVFGDLHIHDRDNPTVWQNVMDGFDAVMDYAGKNLLIPIPQTVTSNGVTFAVYEDGACKAQGTATAETWSTYCPVILDAGEYILSGSDGDVDVELWNDSGSTLLYRSSLGEEIRFTVSSKTVFRLYARVASGHFANTRVEPMIRDARIASDKYRRPMLITRETRSSSFSLGANSNTNLNITLPTMDGYRPLAILRTWTNNTVLLSYSNTTSLDAIRNGYVTVWVRNVSSAAVSSMTVSVEVLYISIGR